MRRTLRVVALATAALAAAAPAARAQAQEQGPGFVWISAGGQLQSRTFTQSTTFVLYNELATIDGMQTIGRGVVFDISGGYRVWKHLSIGVGLWTFHTTSDSTVIATIPNPLVFGHPTTATLAVTDAAHTTIGVNILVVYTVPLGDKVDLAIALGPSIVHVSQDLATASVPSGSQTPTGSLTNESATSAKAGNAGVDLTYRLTDRFGVGVFGRYAGGEVDLPSSPKFKVGGAQIGGGLRVRF